MNTISRSDITRSIDHAILRPDTTEEALVKELAIAKKLNLFSVCVRPSDVRQSVSYLRGTDTAVGTVIGFPHGGSETRVKVFETETAVRHGASEIDFVLNIGDIKNHAWQKVATEARMINQAAKDFGALKTKAIFENAYLTDEEIAHLSKILGSTGIDFIKTSTGFAPTGATIPQVQIMLDNRVSETLEVKASGGVRTLEDFLNFWNMGVTRLGTSNSLGILEDFEKVHDLTTKKFSEVERNDY